jgi:putative Ca2+/H+ antiporter (TMEM165/GDT1 family)
MDARVLLSAFLALFVAELGDKTQLAVLTLSASSRKPWSVFLGGAAALVLLTGLAALVGEAVFRAVPATTLRRASAALFVAMGFWIWFRK